MRACADFSVLTGLRKSLRVFAAFRDRRVLAVARKRWKKAVIVRDSENARACAPGVVDAVLPKAMAAEGLIATRQNRPQLPAIISLCRARALSLNDGVRRKTRAPGVEGEDAETPIDPITGLPRSPLQHSRAARRDGNAVSEREMVMQAEAFCARFSRWPRWRDAEP